MNDLLTANGRRYERFHLIHNVDRNAGFSALMNYALNGVRVAVARNWLPVVNFDKADTGHFYAPERGENVWEYYFEPVMGVSYSQLEAWIEEGRLQPQEIHRFSSEEILRRHLVDKDRLATFWTDNDEVDRAQWMADMRRRGREMVGRYIRLKPHIQEKFADLHARLIGSRFTFGVHIRGTDFSYADPTPPEKYFAAIRAKAAELDRDDYNIFLATDQRQFVTRFEQEFPGRVLTSDAARSSNDVAPFQMQSVDPYKKGEDVLLDILLLSRCAFLFKSVSAVGEYAMWLNPGLECHDFALESRFKTSNALHWTGAYLKMDVDRKGRLAVLAICSYQILGHYAKAALRKLRKVLPG